MTRWPLLAAAALLAAIAWACWPSPERAVRARVTELVASLNAGAGESDLQRLARAASLASALTPDVVVVIDADRQIRGREAVLGLARQWLQRTSRSPVTLDALDVAVDTGGNRADATLVLRIDDGGQEVRLALVRPERTWLVSRAERVDALQRPALGR